MVFASFYYYDYYKDCYIINSYHDIDEKKHITLYFIYDK